MPLDQIEANAPSQTYARINAAIRTLNDVLSSIARIDGIQTSTTQNTTAITALNKGLSEAYETLSASIGTEQSQRETAVLSVRRDVSGQIQAISLDLGERLDRLTGDVLSNLLKALMAIRQGDHPGIVQAAFEQSSSVPFGDAVSLDQMNVVSTPLGMAYRMNGAGAIAPRATITLDIDAISVVRARYWRLVDVLDPNNNAVDIGIQWLGADDSDVGRTLIRRERNLQVQDGPQLLSVRVPSEEGVFPVIAPPKGALSWRPYIQAYGADGATAVAVLGVSDATFAGVYAPDVMALAARLGTIEGQIAAGLPFSTPILPSFAVADLPSPGNPGRKAFARDGCAPSAAGSLEAAGAGTGVEVVDNGQAWVISGTNQAVQA